MTKLEKLRKSGYIDKETETRSDELLRKYKKGYEDKVEELEERLNKLLASGL